MRRALVLWLAVALGLPGAAAAGTAGIEAGVLRVEAAPGERNDVVITLSDGVVSATELSSPLTAGPGCHQDGLRRVECPAPARVEIRLLDGDDSAELAGIALPSTVFGGDGSDRLVGGRGQDRLLGEGGDDRIDARGPFADTLDGGSGQNELLGDSDDEFLPDTLAPRVRIGSDRLRVTRAGRRLEVTLGCPAHERGGCAVRVALQASEGGAFRAVSAGRGRIPAGRTYRFPMSVSRRGYARLARARTVRVRVLAADRAGNRAQSVRTYRARRS